MSKSWRSLWLCLCPGSRVGSFNNLPRRVVIRKESPPCFSRMRTLNPSKLLCFNENPSSFEEDLLVFLRGASFLFVSH